ncbi:MAG: 50S ribosomal protein L18 [Candidatus Paceibacterota bacterium]|jgi:large subunit ribosomal protein L18
MRHKKSYKKILKKIRVHKKIRAISSRPRLLVFRSLRQISAQIIDNKNNEIITQANSLKIKKGKMTKTAIAEKIGQTIAQNAIKQNIHKVVFDKGPYKYHGRVKALADAARKEGLEF